MRWRLALILALALAACGPDDVQPPSPQANLDALPRVAVTVGSLELEVAVADSAEQRAQGLAGIEDLGTLDGLLFVFPAEVETTFTMRETLIPLHIAFISAAGRVIDVQSMTPCTPGACQPYAAPSPYRWAIETPAGDLANVEIGDVFSIRR